LTPTTRPDGEAVQEEGAPGRREPGALGGNARTPRADAAALSNLTASSLRSAFQVTAENPLTGLEGRAAVLRQNRWNAVSTSIVWRTKRVHGDARRRPRALPTRRRSRCPGRGCVRGRRGAGLPRPTPALAGTASRQDPYSPPPPPSASSGVTATGPLLAETSALHAKPSMVSTSSINLRKYTPGCVAAYRA